MTGRDDWGRQVIETALAYANHRWTAGAGNVLHGLDADGCPVDTPDVSWAGERLDCGWWRVGEVNVGIPYGWGNASTIEEFEAGLSAGLCAGNVPEEKTRPVSRHTVGVDCSGLLSICWALPRRIATRDIPAWAGVVERLEEIRQGDVFAKVGSHVMLFRAFADAERREAIIIDATRSTGKVSQRTENVAELFAKGYLIFRKNR